MTGYRYAAAALNDLHDDDRAWMLAALPPDDRAVIVGHLEELKALGFSTGDAAGNAVGETAIPGGAGASARDARACVWNAAARDVVRGLEHEPAALIAHLLRIANWPWSDAFLQSLEPIQRERVSTLVANGSTAPARDAFLVEALADSLRDVRRTAADAEVDSLRSRLVGGVRRLVPMFLRRSAV